MSKIYNLMTSLLVSIVISSLWLDQVLAGPLRELVAKGQKRLNEDDTFSSSSKARGSYAVMYGMNVE